MTILNKTLSALRSCSFMIGATVVMLASSCGGAQQEYYFDATNGDDANSGTSAGKAWKSIEKLNEMTLSAGTKVFLKRGETFSGVVEIKGEGNEQMPVIIGAYGNGEALPVISAPDSSMYAVRILNSNHLTLQDVEIVNHGTTDLPGRTGLKIEARDCGVSRAITVNGVTIRDVNGSLVKEKGGGSGLLVANGGDSIATVFDGLTIENCRILRCQRNAMIWAGYWNRDNWHPSRNVVVRGNLIEGVPGDGIVPIGCYGTLIEHNVMRDCPETLPDTEAAAGIWPWSCDNTVIQFNEVSGHKAPWDGQGYDCDYNCDSTTIRYNYSHDNYGGLVLICNSGRGKDTGNRHSLVEYNISINDGIRPNITRTGDIFAPAIHIAGPCEGARVEHNILHQQAKAMPTMDRRMVVSDSWNGFAENTLFSGNIFFAEEQSEFVLTESTGNTFSGNAYLGKCKAMNTDEKARVALDGYSKEKLQDLFDTIDVAGVKGVFVNKEKIEKMFK